jgi:FtsP/CotA-like multicopper oxidase with cupredoxin domain
MLGNQRIARVVGALVVAVVAFLIARPGGDDDDDSSERAAQTAPAQSEARTSGETTETEAGAEPAPPPKPKITRIRLRGGTVVGGVKRVQATTGDTVRILVTSDAPDELHLHGYDIYENAAPGKPAQFLFRADIEGVFELESHVAEDAGRNPLIGRVVVEPA